MELSKDELIMIYDSISRYKVELTTLHGQKSRSFEIAKQVQDKIYDQMKTAEVEGCK